MGTYEQYLENKRLTAPETRASMEVRVSAALDVDEAVRAARERVESFLNAYLIDRETEQALGESYVAQGSERWGQQILRDIQQLATMEKKPDGSQEALLLDDLLILVHRVGNWPRDRA